MGYLVIGIAVAANLIVIKYKLDKNRYEDAFFDFLILATITAVFKETYGGLVVGTIASCFVSLYLYVSPPTFFSGENGFFKKFKERAKRKGKR